jgi:hypothetical protein
MSGKLMIRSYGSPLVVQQLDLPSTFIHHWFQCEGHTDLEAGIPANSRIVWNLRRFMHFSAYAMAYEISYYGKPVPLHVTLHCCRYVLKPFS